MRSRSIACAVTVVACLAAAGPASASLRSHGQLLHLAPHAKANTNQSSNWFGYNQGTLEQGSKLFTSISGTWVVPAASLHTNNQAESSSTWIGIGGGCVDAGCTVGDNTLIQTGTEQDVSANGTPSYSAWWEIIPAPSLGIGSFPVSAGDIIHADISEVAPLSDVWNITLTDETKGNTFQQTVPYPSDHLTAEWIEETPLLIGSASLADLPNLTTTPFSAASTNGGPANLKTSEQMQLIDANGNVIGTPSAPKSATSFDACAWATSCS